MVLCGSGGKVLGCKKVGEVEKRPWGSEGCGELHVK